MLGVHGEQIPSMNKCLIGDKRSELANAHNVLLGDSHFVAISGLDARHHKTRTCFLKKFKKIKKTLKNQQS
jgi:hypothetical protein